MKKIVQRFIHKLDIFLDHIITRLVFCLMMLWFATDMFIQDMLTLAVVYFVLGGLNCWLAYQKVKRMRKAKRGKKEEVK
jgi:hypothetical protein